MNSIHNNGENDTSLNDGLDKLGQAYGRLEQDEPPELLDQAILNIAHRAVEKKPHWMKFGWLHGLTTTAVFVLAFSLILNQPESTPVYENDIGSNVPVPLKRERVAKKQSQDVQVNELRMEMKEKSEIRQDRLQPMPAATAPVKATIESAPDDEAGQPVGEVQSSMYIEDSLQSRGERIDKDTVTSGFLEEEVVSDEVADTPQAGAAYSLSRSVPVAEPAEFEAEKRAKTDSEIEQKLLAIIKLKQSGNETWKTELKSFKESYPDYPLPDELRH